MSFMLTWQLAQRSGFTTCIHIHMYVLHMICIHKHVYTCTCIFILYTYMYIPLLCTIYVCVQEVQVEERFLLVFLDDLVILAVGMSLSGYEMKVCTCTCMCMLEVKKN